LTEARAVTSHAAPNDHAGLIWAIADLLRGDHKRAEYRRVVLPLVLLRRRDCVFEPTRPRVLARHKSLTAAAHQTVRPNAEGHHRRRGLQQQIPDPPPHPGRPLADRPAMVMLELGVTLRQS